MGRIHVLDDAVINKIAAGEVVERPASVVKELIENALDAGASRIEVALELGGARSISVVDDGVGMERDDAVLAVTRHATSKIRSAEDLFAIHSMGFRGEALASIASVSRFSLATNPRRDDAEAQGAERGVRLSMAGDDASPQVSPWGGAYGTTISVENLFYNLPVRAKFLKAPATEFSHCLELVQAFALSRPDVGFVLTHNGREQFRVGGIQTTQGEWITEEVMRERAKQVLPRETSQSLVYVQHASRFGNIEALVSPPGIEKATSRFIFSFVNGRAVRDKVLRYGIMRGYHSHLLKGRFPIAIMHVTLDPTLVDVNVHPAKTELRFQYPGELQSAVALAIREKLRDASWASAPLPDFSDNRVTNPAEAAPRPSSNSAATFRYGAERGLGARFADASVTSFRAKSASRATPGAFLGEATANPPSFADSPHGAIDEASELVIPWDELHFVGAFERCYLMFAHDRKLLVIDQHAFHERIIYERLTRNEALLSQSQPLLVPEAVEVSPSEAQATRARRHALLKRGFDLDIEGDTTILVKAVPSLLAGKCVADLLSDLARGQLAEEPDAHELKHLILATTACHAAVRAGEELGVGELKQLLAEARAVDFYHNCPHGRRVFRWWTNAQVAQWFDR